MVVPLRIGPDGSRRNKKVLPASAGLNRLCLLTETDFVEASVLWWAGLPLLLVRSLWLLAESSVGHLVR